MKFCAHCGRELTDDTVFCPGCGNPTAETPAYQPAPQYQSAPQYQNDTVNVGLCILAALIPLFGIIYWPVKARVTPKRARACGITAIISWAVSFVIYMVALMGMF